MAELDFAKLLKCHTLPECSVCHAVPQLSQITMLLVEGMMVVSECGQWVCQATINQLHHNSLFTLEIDSLGSKMGNELVFSVL